MLLFQRQIAIAWNVETVDLESIFKHELSPYPAALFQSLIFPRSAKKPKLIEGLLQFAVYADSTAKDSFYVHDGGALLQKLKWDKGQSFQEIAEMYKGYILRHFGNRVAIVFDGYPENQ